MSDSKTEFTIFSRKNDKHLQNSKTVVVGSSRIEKSNQCKYIGVTIDRHLDFETETKKELKNMAVGIITIETTQHKLPKTVLLMLFQVLVLIHLEYSALFLLQITSTLLLSLYKQENWASKSVYFRSSIKGSIDLRIHKSVLGIRQRIEPKSLTYFFQYINKRKKPNIGRRKLPTANFRLKNRSNQIFHLAKEPSDSSSSKSFLHHISLK